MLMLTIQDPSLTSQLRSLRFLVLDEADRMIEAGHFQELDDILRLTARPPPDIDTFVFFPLNHPPYLSTIATVKEPSRQIPAHKLISTPVTTRPLQSATIRYKLSFIPPP